MEFKHRTSLCEKLPREYFFFFWKVSCCAPAKLRASERGEKHYRFLGKRDRLGASWHSICFPIITSIFVHNWVREGGKKRMHMPVITVTTGKRSSPTNILSGRHERKHFSVRCQGGREAVFLIAQNVNWFSPSWSIEHKHSAFWAHCSDVFKWIFRWSRSFNLLQL